MGLFDFFKKQTTEIKFNNNSIRIAVKKWCESESSAIKKYGHISQWDTSLVTNMSQLFLNANDFDSPIGNWDVSNVTTMHAMFDNAYKFNQDISSWNVSKVTDMSEMFSATADKGLSFNQPIGNWDVSNVNNMVQMFCNAESFNQPIGNWDVSNVNDMAGMFYNAIYFNQPIGNWDVSNVNNMELMFYNAESFNQPIGNWNVSNVNNMFQMFYNAKYFNQPIGNWDVSNVNDMAAIFCNAESFNQPIGNWDLSKIGDIKFLFEEPEDETRCVNRKEFEHELKELSNNSNFLLLEEQKKFNLFLAAESLIPAVSQKELENMIGKENFSKSILELDDVDLFKNFNQEIFKNLVHNKISLILQTLIGLAQFEGGESENQIILINQISNVLRDFYSFDEDIKLNIHPDKNDIQLSLYNALLYSYFDDAEKKLIIELMTILTTVDGIITLRHYLYILNISNVIQFPVENLIDIIFSNKLDFHGEEILLDNHKIIDYEDFLKISKKYYNEGYGNSVISLFSS